MGSRYRPVTRMRTSRGKVARHDSELARGESASVLASGEAEIHETLPVAFVGHRSTTSDVQSFQEVPESGPASSHMPPWCGFRCVNKPTGNCSPKCQQNGRF